MKTKFSGILTLLLALVVQISFAQEKTISGTVTDDSGQLLLAISHNLGVIFTVYKMFIKLNHEIKPLHSTTKIITEVSKPTWSIFDE
jgi:hypothetical protein